MSRSHSVEGSLVLIVEDDEDSRAVYREALEARGAQVLVAVTGTEGLDLARSRRPDVILMDISIPEMDGWTVAAKLNEDPGTADMRVIVVTAYAFPEDQARADQLGCAALLTKPCGPTRILAEIDRVLGAPQST